MTTCSASAKNSQRSINTPIVVLSRAAAATANCTACGGSISSRSHPGERHKKQQHRRHAAKLHRVTPRHLIAHLAHHVVRLGVRRVERPHRAETGRGRSRPPRCRSSWPCRSRSSSSRFRISAKQQRHAADAGGPADVMAEDRQNRAQQHAAGRERQHQIDRRDQRLVPGADGGQRGVDHPGAPDRHERARHRQPARQRRSGPARTRRTPSRGRAAPAGR